MWSTISTRSLWAKLVVVAAVHGFLVAAASQCGQATHSAPLVPGILWQFDAGGTISTKPVANGELLFVTSDSGKIYALKKDTGKKVWTFDSHSDGIAVFRGGPLLYGEVVIVGATEQSCVTNQRGYIYGLEQRTGNLRWKAAVPGVRTNLLQMGNAAIFGTGQNEWISVELRTGKLNWKFSAPDSDHRCYENSSPATDSVNIVVVARNLKLYGLDAAGRKVWEKLSDAAVSTNPFVYKDVAYFGTTNKHVYGVNPATGEALVDLPVPAMPMRGFIWGGEHGDESEYSIGLVESNGSKRNVLLAYSDEFERVLWSHDSDAEWRCETPFYWHNLVLVGDCSGQITAYTANDGRPQWNAAVNGCVRILAGDRLAFFVGVEQGTLYSLGYPPQAHDPR
jgi:outer membrane protein assembly factor BamB